MALCKGSLRRKTVNEGTKKGGKDNFLQKGGRPSNRRSDARTVTLVGMTKDSKKYLEGQGNKGY